MKINKTKMKYGANNALVLAGVLAIVILINLLLSAWVATSPIKIDLTKGKVYSLSDQTKDILNDLDDNITLYYVTQKNSENQQIMEILNLYQKNSDKITVVKLTDTEKNPQFLSKYGVLYADSVVAISETNRGKSRTISPDEMLRNKTDENNQVVLNSQVEGQVTAAISFVSSKDTPKIYYSTGHGEQDFTHPAQMLSGENIQSLPIDLTTEEIPNDADLLIIAGPTLDFEQEVIVKLDNYFERGGKVQFYSYAPITLPALNEYFHKEWGLYLEHDYAYEKNKSYLVSQMYGASAYLYMLPQLGEHEITEYVKNNKGSVLWPYSSGANTITVLENDKVEANVLLKTSQEGGSYKVADIMAQEEIENPVSHMEGEANLLVYARKNAINNLDTTARLLLCGAIDPLYMNITDQKYMNKELLIRSINYMAGFEEAPVLVQPKLVGETSMKINEWQAFVYLILLWGVLPLALFVGGIAVWLRRRHL